LSDIEIKRVDFSESLGFSIHSRKSKMLLRICLLVIVSAICCDAVRVRLCSGDKKGTAKITDVRISDCGRTPCKLKKGTDANFEVDFVASEDSAQAVNNVWATLAIIPVPFIGVHGTDACPQIFTTDDANSTTPAGCPLEAGKTYTYRNSFHIMDLYPAVSVKVEYGINDENGKMIMCFQVPAKIVS